MSPKTCGPLDPQARLRRGPPPTLGKGGALPDLSLPIGLPPALARVAAARAAETREGPVSGRVAEGADVPPEVDAEELIAVFLPAW